MELVDLAKEVTEFLAGERMAFHYNADWLARAIWRESLHNKCWAQATLPQWEQAIREAISRGLIVEKDKRLGLPAKVEEEKPQQMGLFE